ALITSDFDARVAPLRLAVTVHESQGDADGLRGRQRATGGRTQLGSIIGVNRTREKIFDRPERRHSSEGSRFGIEADAFGNEIPAPDADMGGRGEEFEGLMAGLKARIEGCGNGQAVTRATKAGFRNCSKR